ncbi:hypothetical protein [Nocardioides astragali]|uniref:DksA C4-type domain-containing protein n=1 Tax=Nocardioides astragali TaxID=1776736 RepID=A0ABW2MYN7_9ACTN
MCARCETRIHAKRIELQPWVITCTACAPPDRPVSRPVPAIESE